MTAQATAEDLAAGTTNAADQAFTLAMMTLHAAKDFTAPVPEESAPQIMSPHVATTFLMKANNASCQAPIITSTAARPIPHAMAQSLELETCLEIATLIAAA